ncbi:organomercurial lyase [Roseovarius nitratireducens]|uniref:organomercurial lyase n=1 Tax=Roseovarius nitratireducens TaxID=2044597 RepID=UPI000CE19A4D|nr:organomercurial lyase [Roseovarius nitratireducens]
MENRAEDYAPDNSIISDSIVLEALGALMTGARLAARWGGLSPASLQAHQAILHAYLTSGDPPSVSEFSADTLSDLGQRDLVHVRDGRIALAYPFSTRPTDFQVRVGGGEVHAICAVDALGTAAMAREQAEVTCVCPTCRAGVSIGISPGGLTVEHASTPDPRVWTGVKDVGTCAADSQCKSMLLFCSPEHLDTWKRSQPQSARGFDLSLEQGVRLGAAIFRPFLHAQTNKASS